MELLNSLISERYILLRDSEKKGRLCVRPQQRLGLKNILYTCYLMPFHNVGFKLF